MDRFVLLEEIGRGMFAVVHRAYDLSEGREMAIKIYRTHEIAPDTVNRFIERVCARAEILSEIMHPNIVSPYQYDADDATFWLAMPLIQGRNLSRLIPDRGFDKPVEAVRIATTVLRALQYLHEMRICHRDVGANNILIAEDGNTYLMGFGRVISLCWDGSVQQEEYGMVMGVCAYMPPEELRVETDRIGPWSDQYSCGGMLYKMLTGHSIYAGKGIALVADMCDPKKRPIPLRRHRPDLDPALERLVLKSIEKAPSDRFGCCEEFANHLDDWCASKRRRAAVTS